MKGKKMKKILNLLKNNENSVLLLALSLLCVIILFVSSAVIRNYDIAKDYIAPNVVAFKVPFKDQIYGTGFRLKYEGKTYIITNRHVCNVSKMWNEKIARVDDRITEILKISKKWDLCALRTTSDSGLRLAKNQGKNMDSVILVGHPLGQPKTSEKGRIMGFESPCVNYGSFFVPDIKCVKSLKITALSYGGNSGSPVTNDRGDVIGVLYAGNPAYPHYPFIVPLEGLLEFLKTL